MLILVTDLKSIVKYDKLLNFLFTDSNNLIVLSLFSFILLIITESSAFVTSLSGLNVLSEYPLNIPAKKHFSIADLKLFVDMSVNKGSS